MSPRDQDQDDRILEQPEYDRIRDVAEQLNLLAYLVAKAATPTRPAKDQRPRPLDLHLPSPGLNAMLRAWSEALRDALAVTDQTMPTGPMPTGPVAKVAS